MYLSKLVFLCVKNVLYFNDPSFNETDFLKGSFDNDSDYGTSINNVFQPLNTAIAVLSDYDLIPYRVESVKCLNGVIDLTKLEHECKEVVNVGCLFNGRHTKLEHADYGVNKVKLLRNSFTPTVDVEYKEDIPTFERYDIPTKEFDKDKDEWVLNENDVDLKKEFGITETMCQYIIEFVQGKLLEPIAPELANLHKFNAENCFKNMNVAKSLYRQKSITTMYRVGE